MAEFPSLAPDSSFLHVWAWEATVVIQVFGCPHSCGPGPAQAFVGYLRNEQVGGKLLALSLLFSLSLSPLFVCVNVCLPLK